MAKRFTVPPNLFKPKYATGIPTEFDARELTRTEKALGVKLPAAYVEVLKVQNGGPLRLTQFKMKRKPPKGTTWSRSQTYRVGELPGIHPTHHDSLTARGQNAAEWGVDAGLIPLDGDGHYWVCLDYRKSGPRGEPAITHWEEPEPRIDAKDDKALTYRVADSFAQLVLGLKRSAEDYEPATIALDGAGVRGGALERILKSLGCKRNRYPGVIYSSVPLPTRWDWPKYKSFVRGLDATLTLEKNNTYGYAPKFPERPKGHKMLRVSVVPKQADACLAELAEALGPKAVLLRGVV